MIKKILKAVIVTIAWLAIWEIIHLIVGKDILIPSPISVFMKIIELAGTGKFWGSIGASILRIMIGYFAGLLGGLILGTLTALSKVLDAFFSPIAKIIRATPVASFIILLFVFIVNNHIPAVTAFLMVLPVTWANVYEGIRSTDRKLLDMAKVFEVPRGKTIKGIYIPQIMPFFMAAAKMGMGLAWKAGIAAEVLTNPKFGIGTSLYESKIYLETTDLFAWTAIIIIISVILEKLLVKLIGKIYR